MPGGNDREWTQSHIETIDSVTVGEVENIYSSSSVMLETIINNTVRNFDRVYIPKAKVGRVYRRELVDLGYKYSVEYRTKLLFNL